MSRSVRTRRTVPHPISEAASSPLVQANCILSHTGKIWPSSLQGDKPEYVSIRCFSANEAKTSANLR